VIARKKKKTKRHGVRSQDSNLANLEICCLTLFTAELCKLEKGDARIESTQSPGKRTKMLGKARLELPMGASGAQSVHR
jgi:hypothetical protein